MIRRPPPPLGAIRRRRSSGPSHRWGVIPARPRTSWCTPDRYDHLDRRPGTAVGTHHDHPGTAERNHLRGWCLRDLDRWHGEHAGHHHGHGRSPGGPDTHRDTRRTRHGSDRPDLDEARRSRLPDHRLPGAVPAAGIDTLDRLPRKRARDVPDRHRFTARHAVRVRGRRGQRQRRRSVECARRSDASAGPSHHCADNADH